MPHITSGEWTPCFDYALFHIAKPIRPVIEIGIIDLQPNVIRPGDKISFRVRIKNNGPLQVKIPWVFDPVEVQPPVEKSYTFRSFGFALALKPLDKTLAKNLPAGDSSDYTWFSALPGSDSHFLTLNPGQWADVYQTVRYDPDDEIKRFLKSSPNASFKVEGLGTMDDESFMAAKSGRITKHKSRCREDYEFVRAGNLQLTVQAPAARKQGTKN